MNMQGYQDYFLSRRRWFFGFAALTEALDVVDTLIKGEDHLRSLGLEYLLANGAFILVCARSRDNAQFEIPYAVCVRRGRL